MRPKTSTAPQILTLAEVAERLRIAPGDGRSVRAALKAMGVPVLRLPGKRAIVSAEEFERVLAARLKGA